MAKRKPTIDQMEGNPKGDWTIDDVLKVVRQEGLSVRNNGGSHNAICSPHLRDLLTVPFSRPIKPIYIKLLVSYVRAHRDFATKEEGQ